MNQATGSKAFDVELSLRELLPAKEADRLVASLGMLLDSPVALLDLRGDVLAGAQGLPAGAAERTELVLELEPVGYLLAPRAGPVQRGAAAALVRQLLVARARYKMATGVHIASVQADYEELQRQNAALKLSEANYKALSESLEATVAAQVKIIDERQRQLYQAERLASIGQLAAGVAHEINNPIGFVRSNLSTAEKYLGQIATLGEGLRKLPGGEELRAAADLDFLLDDFADLLRDSLGGVDRVAKIVADLKGFSSVDRPQEEIMDLNEILASVCNLVEPKLPPGVMLRRALNPLPRTMCLPGHLSQALLAIVDNAVQAAATRLDGGEVKVSSHAVNDQSVLVVEDNGNGIEAAALARVFDPFYTTRPVGQGTGLGLTVARDIVQVHGGQIELDSTPGQGTRVSVMIPQ
ncbi:MAG TPA: ATP-binding protein [Rhodocyclaceae bacterium]|nr:ATP-binding protein [Rhodocyclaceae bacterium]